MSTQEIVQPDARGRVALRKHLDPERHYLVSTLGDSILLQPAVVMPEAEAALYADTELYAKVLRRMNNPGTTTAHDPAAAIARRAAAQEPADDDDGVGRGR